MTYIPQAGDTVMDEAIGLLEEANELLEMDNSDEAESWKERVENFINERNK